MLKTLLLVGAGSFLGGALRYVVTLWMKGVCHQGFPWGTLLVNLLGCLLLGLIV
jgi:CrcB protein